MTNDGIPAKLEIVRLNLERLEQLPQATYAEFNADFRRPRQRSAPSADDDPSADRCR